MDPFHFFQRALGGVVMPVPDTTTRDGARIFFSHIDGDGFRHSSSVEPGLRSGEVIVERIIKKYPFPFTVSFIEAEVRGLVAGQKPGDAELLTRQAREVLALSKVEAASHAYTHPFYWNASDRTLQITSANENENIYRERWAVSGDTESPFFGGFLLAQDGFERMEQPRRLKPVNIYFHFYSGDNLASLNALTRLFDWAMRQELHAITAADYARLVRDARSARVIRESDVRWTFVTGGAVRTFRLPKSALVPDLAASRGVTGWRVTGDVIYVHTDGSPRVELALSSSPAAHLRLDQSTAEIQFTRLATREAAFTVRDIRPCQVTLAGSVAHSTAQVTVNGKPFSAQCDAMGVLKLSLPAEAKVEIKL
ncbi:MAG: hypothetical protein EB082_06445 [Verrucomicrobia bacterium]|nr:hypothetical protein [Verrucomicrobiota bacterium]